MPIRSRTRATSCQGLGRGGVGLLMANLLVSARLASSRCRTSSMSRLAPQAHERPLPSPPSGRRTRPRSGAAAPASRAPPRGPGRRARCRGRPRRWRGRVRTATLRRPWTGRPVRGSMMCAYVTPSFSKKRWRSRPETESARSRSGTVRAVFAGSVGSWIPISQAVSPRRRAQAVDAAAAEVDQGRGDAPLAQQRHDAVHRVALADAAEVELDAGAVEADRPGGAVQLDVPVADDGERPGELVLGGHAALVAEEAPGLHERPHGDVEGPVRLAAPAQALGQEVEELGLHRHGARSRPRG